MGRDKKTSVGYPIKRRELPPTVFCVVDLSCMAGLSTVKATVRLTVFLFCCPHSTMTIGMPGKTHLILFGR